MPADTAPPSEPRPDRIRVRVWFGAHVIAQHIAEPALARRYAEAMSRRFLGLRITTEELPTAQGEDDLAELPAEPLWPLTVR
jgi:hypothetical protein